MCGEPSTSSGVSLSRCAIRSAVSRHVVRDDHVAHGLVQLDLGEPIAGGLADPGDLARRRLGGAVGRVLQAVRPRAGVMLTMSASRAAIESTRLLPPPMMKGGCGFWTGCGGQIRSVTV